MLVQEFPDLARAYSVSSVPLTVMEPVRNGSPVAGEGSSVLGARPEEVFVEAIASVGAPAGEETAGEA